MTATVTDDGGATGWVPPVDDPRAAAYVAAVADALAGVPDPARRELLEDLAAHLAELLDEPDDGVSLEARLGPPAAYAADLLAAAGIDVPGRTWPPAAEWRRARDRFAGWGSSPAARAVLAFLPELRPAWWVLRAWGALALLAVFDDGSVFPVPDAFGNPLLNLAALVGLAVASVRLGRSALSRPWLRRILNAVGVIGVVLAMGQGGNHVEYVSDGCGPYGCDGPGLLVNANGSPITNIWPFDGDGRLLEGVLLFDQDGRPLTVGNEQPGSVVIPGLFPQEQREVIGYDTTGEPRWRSLPPPSVAIPRVPTSSAPANETTTTTVPAEAPPLP